MTDFFLHIPKCAGTSIKTLIAEKGQAFTHREIFDISNKEESIKNIDACYRLVIGHFGYNFIRKFHKPGDRMITFLRDPDSRILSMYNYWSSGQAKTGSSHSSIGLSLEDFLNQKENNVTEQLINIQTWMLASDYRYSERERLKKLKPYEILDLAKQHLSSFDFIGLQENYNNSVDVIADMYGVKKEDRSYKVINKTKYTIETHPDSSLLEPFSYLDRELYLYAETLIQNKNWF